MNTFLTPRTRLILSLLAAAVGLCLLFSDIYSDFEWSPGWIGTLVFMGAVWSAVAAIHYTAESDAEQQIPPGEWKAWVDTSFLTAILLAMGVALAVSPAAPIDIRVHGDRVGRLLTGIFIAWAIVAYSLQKRWGGRVVEDERDIQIQLKCTKLSLYLMVCGLFAFVIFLTANPLERLQWLSFGLIAHILIMIMVAAHLIGNFAQAVYYTRERLAVDA